MSRRGYYRIPAKIPANRVDGPLAEAVKAKFAEGWSKARIAREFRLNRRTVIRICTPTVQVSRAVPLQLESSTPNQEPTSDSLIKCIGCGIEIPKHILRAHWGYCPAVRSGRLSLEDCPV
jgi:hypothetical protein